MLPTLAVPSPFVSGDVSFAPRRRHVRHGWGGFAGLVYPTTLVALGLSVGFRQDSGAADLAASFLGAILFLIAAPTAWIFAFPFIEVTRFTVIVVGVLTSFPLWYLVGRALANGSSTWASWVLRYAGVSFTWTISTLLAIALLALGG